jgi:hypothetical protein
MGTAKTSAFKKNYIFNKVNSQGEYGLGYREEKLIAEFILDTNSSRKTVLELLKTFENAERIIRSEGMIYSLAFFNKDLSIKQNGESRETAE